jgi:hypothetical protein
MIFRFGKFSLNIEKNRRKIETVARFVVLVSNMLPFTLHLFDKSVVYLIYRKKKIVVENAYKPWTSTT